jgi:hypothetical protein
MGNVCFKNQCSFNVTTWLIAGPDAELAPGENKTVDTQAIWYSSRAKGPGNKVDDKFMKIWKEELDNNVRDTSAISQEELNEQGTKVIIGQIVASMYDVFNMVPTSVVDTDNDRYIYIGCHLDGIYGGGNPNIAIKSEIIKEKIYDSAIKKYVTVYDMKMNY